MKLRGYFIVAAICAILGVFMFSSCAMMEKMTDTEKIDFVADVAKDLSKLKDVVEGVKGPSIDFKDVENWEALSQDENSVIGHIFILKRNPDPLHVVKYVLVRRFIGLDWAITGYAYYEGEKLFVYELDAPPPNGNFVLRTVPLSEESKKEIWGMLHPAEEI